MSGYDTICPYRFALRQAIKEQEIRAGVKVGGVASPKSKWSLVQNHFNSILDMSPAGVLLVLLVLLVALL